MYRRTALEGMAAIKWRPAEARVLPRTLLGILSVRHHGSDPLGIAVNPAAESVQRSPNCSQRPFAKTAGRREDSRRYAFKRRRDHVFLAVVRHREIKLAYCSSEENPGYHSPGRWRSLTGFTGRSQLSVSVVSLDWIVLRPAVTDYLTISRYIYGQLTNYRPIVR
jgi:hypothetical protein